MSKIRLNSITVKRSMTEDPMNYIGAVVESESGYLTPRLFTSTQQIDSVLGEFKYNQMYKDLIARNIAVCLLPIITKESEYNRCSLRLSNDTITECHPKFKKQYKFTDKDSLINRDYSLVNEVNKFYGLILDFTDVDLNVFLEGDNANDDNLNSNYIIINTGKPLNIDNYWDQLISTDMDPNISSSDYDLQKGDTPIYIKYQWEVNSDTKEIKYLSTLPAESTKYDYVNNLKNIWNSIPYITDTGSVCKSLEDLIIDYIKDFIVINGLPSSNPLSTTISISEWKSKFINDSFIEDFYAYDNKYVGNILTELVRVFPDEVTSEDWLRLTESNLISRIKYMKLSNDKLLFQFTYPAVNLNHFKFEGLKMYPVANYSQDILCNYTNRSKVVEFYSKIKGPAGKNIVINISQPKFEEQIYEITISNGLIFESYAVKLFDLDNSIRSAIHITEIGKQSQLVDVYLYNYWYGKEIDSDVTNQVLIDDRYFDPYGEVGYYYKNKRSEVELRLPLGEFRLDRVALDPVSLDDKINSINIFKSSRWYPDLFLVPTMENSKEFLNTLISSVDSPIGDSINYDLDERSMYSQLLINLDYRQLNDLEWYTTSQSGKYRKLPSSNNRVLYFHGKLLIDGLEYPSFYPYIYNLMNQNYLEYPAQDMIYDPFELKVGNTILLYQGIRFIDSCEITYLQVVSNGTLLGLKSQHLTDEYPAIQYMLLNDGVLRKVDPQSLQVTSGEKFELGNLMTYIDNRQINFLKYDNLNYYWESIQETVDQPDVFMIRFISSKYVRETYKRVHELVGNSDINIKSIVSDINNKCKNYLKFVQSSNMEILYNIEDPSLIKITYTITVQKLINRTFKLDIILNV